MTPYNRSEIALVEERIKTLNTYIDNEFKKKKPERNYRDIKEFTQNVSHLKRNFIGKGGKPAPSKIITGAKKQSYLTT